MRLWGLLPLLATLMGCQGPADPSQDQHHLRWQFAGGVVHEYDMVYTEVAPEPHLLIAGLQVSDDSAARAQAKQVLGDLSLPVAGYRATVAHKGPHMHARVVGVQPEFAGPPADWEEEYDRAVIAANVGNVVLAGDFSAEGELLSFFLAARQQSLNNLLFALPPMALQPGDSWPLDVYGLELGSGFIPDSATRVARGYLEGVHRDELGRRVAEVFYLVGEDVSGHFRIRQGEALQDIPLAVSYTYVGHAHFLLDEGRWLDYTALGIHTANGTDREASVTVYALRPVQAD
ncbi:MAG: hypothetical protein LAT63_10235 [Marinobacter sp.]|nr:hypothetical protein [Marinobacter sp.]